MKEMTDHSRPRLLQCPHHFRLQHVHKAMSAVLRNMLASVYINERPQRFANFPKVDVVPIWITTETGRTNHFPTSKSLPSPGERVAVLL